MEEGTLLQIDPEKVCFIIIKAREFDAKEEPMEEDYASNAADEGMREVLEDKPGAARDIVVLNAGAAIYAADLAASLEEGVERAQEVIASGAALERLQRLVTVSNSFKTA